MSVTRSIYMATAIGLCGCSGEIPTSDSALRTAQQAYDPQLLVQSIEELETWHVANNTGLVDELRPAISAPALVNMLSSIGCYPTNEMKLLWGWHDGNANSSVPLVWYHDFLPVDKAITEYWKLRLNPLVAWDPRYLPMFSFEGEWYASYCDNSALNAGPVVHFFLEDTARITHKNLTTFMTGMVTSMREKAITWENGAMIEDIGEIHRIHQEYNSGYEFPYHLPDDF